MLNNGLPLNTPSGLADDWKLWQQTNEKQPGSSRECHLYNQIEKTNCLSNI
mgnify:CR=1 FL=1